MKIVFLTPFNTISLLLQMTLRFNGYIENGYECDFFISLLYEVFMTICGNFGFGINLRSGILFWQMGEEKRMPGTFTSQIICHPFVAYLSIVMLSYVMLCMWANQILLEIHAVGSKTCLLSRQGEQQVEKQKTSWKKTMEHWNLFSSKVIKSSGINNNRSIPAGDLSQLCQVQIFFKLWQSIIDNDALASLHLKNG